MNDQTTSPVKVPGIREHSDGTFIIDCVKTIQGKRIHIYSSGYLSQEEALLAMPRLIAAKTSFYSNLRSRQMTLDTFLKQYEEYRLLHVRPSSVAFGRSAAKTFFIDALSLNVSDAFCFTRIKAVYQNILAHQGGAAWKNRCIGVFRQMAEAAFKWKLLDAESYQDALSVLENIPENRGAKKNRPIWNKKEKDAFLSVIHDEEDKLLFELLITLGARIGEFAGLTWDCYNPKAGTIEIKQQLVYQNVGKWVLSSDLKTRESYRICKLSSYMNDALKKYRERSGGFGFIFKSKTEENAPMSKAVIRRKMYRYIELSGVKRITPHCLRHAKATDLMRVCRDMEEVKAAARYLGHSATMMVDTYGHSQEAATLAVLRRLEKEEGR